jgi:L-alanine-DL-glutamate epimerase-like enolase superfamily enzyme
VKITRLKTAVIEGNFDWTLVRLETDEGLRGLGECFFAPGLTSLLRALEPLLIGEDPKNIRRLFRKLQMAASGSGSLAGMAYNAISGIEAALWDLRGQQLGVPICELLGGRFRDKIRVYADCHGGDALESHDEITRPRAASWARSELPEDRTVYFEQKATSITFTPEMYAARAKAVAAKGYTALKFDLDIPSPFKLDLYNRSLTNQEIGYMASLAAGAREGAGPGVEVAFDCHWQFNLSDAARLAAECESVRPMWLEDPLPPWNVDALRELKRLVRVPIASGENYYLFDGFRSVIEQQALSVVTPDLQKVGGLREAMRIAEFAESYSVPVAPHNISGPVGTLATAHFCAAIPNFLTMEFHAGDVPFWNDLVEGIPKPIIQRGYISVPGKPGLGVTLNEEVARRYARPGEPFLE